MLLLFVAVVCCLLVGWLLLFVACGLLLYEVRGLCVVCGVCQCYLLCVVCCLLLIVCFLLLGSVCCLLCVGCVVDARWLLLGLACCVCVSIVVVGCMLRVVVVWAGAAWFVVVDYRC